MGFIGAFASPIRAQPQHHGQGGDPGLAVSVEMAGDGPTRPEGAAAAGESPAWYSTVMSGDLGPTLDDRVGVRFVTVIPGMAALLGNSILPPGGPRLWQGGVVVDRRCSRGIHHAAISGSARSLYDNTWIGPGHVAGCLIAFVLSLRGPPRWIPFCVWHSRSGLDVTQDQSE